LSNIPELFAELPELSWLRFMDESERSDRRGAERVLDDGEGVGACGLNPYSAKYGWARASAAVTRFFGSKCNIF